MRVEYRVITNFNSHVIKVQVQNCYRIKRDSAFGTKTPTPKQKDMRPRQSQSMIDYVASIETVEEAAVAAAYKIAEAENKSFVAAEAVKEAERVAKMAEETEVMLQLALEIFEKCIAALSNYHLTHIFSCYLFALKILSVKFFFCRRFSR